jgi:hypothetical protein
VRLELLLYAATLRWVARRRAVPAGAQAWGYARLVTPVLWLWVYGSVGELVAFHFLIPWDGVRLAVDLVSLWGLVWMLGMLAGNKVYPHVLTDEALRVRGGVHHDIGVPRASIAGAVVHERDLPSSVWLLQVEPAEAGHHVAVGVSGRTNVTLTLDRPTALATAQGDLTATTVSFWADEPSAIATELDPARRSTAPGPAPR